VRPSHGAETRALRQFLACSGYPKCKSTRGLHRHPHVPVRDAAGTRWTHEPERRFYGCSKYPECKMLFQGEPVRESCPDCQAPVLFRRAGKTGLGTLFCINPSCKFKKKEEPEQASASGGE